jgi:peptidoglycan/xylan/chitin deacetylase (PgdA/CDA1 family)
VATLPRLTFCLTVGMDAMSLWITSFKSSNASMISRGEMDITGTHRLLELMDRYDIRSTFLVPGHTALAYPNLIKDIVARGHELAYHGWMHEDARDFDIAGQRLVIERGLEALDHVAGVRPRGHVAPAWNMSEHTMDLVDEFGFDFDGSRMSTDFLPVYVRKGDRWPIDGAFQFGELTDVIGIPVAWPMDDVPIFEFVWGEIGGLAPASAAEEMWTGEFDYAYEKSPGGVFNLTVHPQVIGRGPRLEMLERLIQRAVQHSDVVFQRQSDYVDAWRKGNPRDEWRARNPELAGDGAISELPSMAD